MIMWKSKRCKYTEALLESIRDRQNDLLNKCDFQEQRLAESQKTIENLVSQNQDLYDRICSVEKNLDYYSMIHQIMTENKYIDLEFISLQLQKSKFKKILIGGFFGADNLGDELMLQTILSYIPKDNLSAVTVLLCDNDGYNYYNHPGVNFIHIPKNKFDQNIMAQYFDVLFWSGGALIDDSDYFKNTITLNNLIIDLSKRFLAFNKTVYAFSLSTNKTLTDKNYIQELRMLCDRCDYFSVRDNNSLNLLNSLNISNITLSDDLVFYNKLFEKDFPEINNEIPVIGINWICYEDTVLLFKHLIEQIYAYFNGNCKIKCIPFNGYLDKKYFEKILVDIKNKINIDIVILDYTNDLESVTREINNTDYMINFRYRGILLSSLLKKKSLNICYDTHRHYNNKIDYITDFFGIKDHLLYFSKLSDKCDNLKINFAPPIIKHNELQKHKKDFIKSIENGIS